MTEIDIYQALQDIRSDIGKQISETREGLANEIRMVHENVAALVSHTREQNGRVSKLESRATAIETIQQQALVEHASYTRHTEADGYHCDPETRAACKETIEHVRVVRKIVAVIATALTALGAAVAWLWQTFQFQVTPK